MLPNQNDHNMKFYMISFRGKECNFTYAFISRVQLSPHFPEPTSHLPDQKQAFDKANEPLRVSLANSTCKTPRTKVVWAPSSTYASWRLHTHISYRPVTAFLIIPLLILIVVRGFGLGIISSCPATPQIYSRQTTRPPLPNNV
jgi:hypothetical protein